MSNKKNKHINASILILIMGMLALTACTSQPTGQVIKREEIKIGAIMPLTGDFAQYGLDEMNAIRLFTDKYNTEHSNQIKLLVEDSQTDPKTGLSAFQKLMLDKPDVFLTIGSSIALAIQPVANEQKTPIIAVGANPAVANGYMIQNLMTSEDHVSVLIKEINNQNIKSIGLIYRNDDLGVSVKDEFKKFFNEKIFEQAVNPDETDFRTTVLKISSKKPDALFVIETGKTLGNLILRIRQQMGNITIFATSEVTYKDVKEVAGKAFHDIIYSDLNLNYENPAIKQFIESYTSKYNTEPSLDSFFAYNSMLLIAKCSETAREGLFECFNKTDFNGLTGELRVSNNRIVYTDSMTTKTI